MISKYQCVCRILDFSSNWNFKSFFLVFIFILELFLIDNICNLSKKFNLWWFSCWLIINLGIFSGDITLLRLNLICSLDFFVTYITIVSCWLFVFSLEIDKWLASLSKERIWYSTVLPPQRIHVFIFYNWSIDVQYFLVVQLLLSTVMTSQEESSIDENVNFTKRPISSHQCSYIVCLNTEPSIIFEALWLWSILVILIILFP